MTNAKRWVLNFAPFTTIGHALFWMFVVWVACVPNDHQLLLIEALTK